MSYLHIWSNWSSLETFVHLEAFLGTSLNWSSLETFIHLEIFFRNLSEKGLYYCFSIILL